MVLHPKKVSGTLSTEPEILRAQMFEYIAQNCFGDIVTDDLRMANLVNYRFSKLGAYSGVVKTFISYSPNQ